MSPMQTFRILQDKIRPEWKAAFSACFFVGMLVHMPVLLSDIPNHDGLASMYSDQNIVVSGRWFLTVACGVSSYYTLPWVIGLLGLLYLGFAAAAMCELLEVRKTWAAALCGALLSVFPAIASTFAYVYTLDGYMMALLLAVLAVLFVKKYRFGFFPGALCLAFSMGIYQAYLPFAMILSVFSIWMLLISAKGFPNAIGINGSGMETVCLKDKVLFALRYLYMGILGALFYYGVLQLLLKLQGKRLAEYQGIEGMVSDVAAERGFVSVLKGMYIDFAAFSLKGNILFQNVFSLTAMLLLAVAALWTICLLFRRAKTWKEKVVIILVVLSAALLPALTNIILLVSPSVNYHLLMRYQWVLYSIGAVALVSGCDFKERVGVRLEWVAFAAAFVLIFCYGITDNIAYSNLHKKYEKTYAYCIRLLDRIEQTPGYYQGIPIAMIGVVGEEQFPVSDLTLSVTAGMVGMSGDSLLYTGANYQSFIRHYLGATLNILPPAAMEEMYYSEEYTAMESFPGEDSIRIIDGIMYIKTENAVK